MLREIAFTLKNVFRDKGFVFWTIAYPLILSTFFYLAFGSLLEKKDFTFPVGIEEGSGLEQIFENIPVFAPKSMKAEEAEAAMQEKQIIAFVTKDLHVRVIGSGPGQTAVQNAVQSMKQMTYAFENGANGELFDPTEEFMTEKVMELSPFSVMFYTILAMVSFYGFFGSIDAMSGIQANVSELGKRMSVSPIRKLPYVFANIMMVFVLNVASNIMVILYMNYGLKIHLFSDFPRSIALLMVGNLCGVAAGVFVGVLTISPQIKAGIGIGVPIFMSALAGMMGIEIKVMVMRYVPMVERLNPASIITNGLYRVNLLESQTDYLTGIAVLLGMSLLFILMSAAALRRKSYDSL